METADETSSEESSAFEEAPPLRSLSPAAPSSEDVRASDSPAVTEVSTGAELLSDDESVSRSVDSIVSNKSLSSYDVSRLRQMKRFKSNSRLRCLKESIRIDLEK